MRGRDERFQVLARPMAFTLFGRSFHHPFLEYRGRPSHDEPNRAYVRNRVPRESDTISARSPGFGVRFAVAPRPSPRIGRYRSTGDLSWRKYVIPAESVRTLATRAATLCAPPAGAGTRTCRRSAFRKAPRRSAPTSA